MATKELFFECIDTGEYRIVSRAIGRSQARYRRGSLWKRAMRLWQRIRHQLGWTKYVEPCAKYKKRAADPVAAEKLPQEVMMAYVMCGSIRSGKMPNVDKLAEIYQTWQQSPDERIAEDVKLFQRKTDALSWSQG